MNFKDNAKEKLLSIKSVLLELSHKIHANPELSFHEEKAVKWLTELLNANHFVVKTNICDLPTAFSATLGNGSLHIAICAEYDALPEIGHACGHNIIAAAATGAALALTQVVNDLDLQISVIGTPAEETGGGKILLLDRGAFKNIHAAMMVHPAPFDILEPSIIAAAELNVRYIGKSAHASAFPELGINAADAMIIAQTAIGLLRQQLTSTERVHGIITKGGDAANIIPAETTAKYIIRSKTIDELKTLQQKITRCFEAGALATGATLELIEADLPYSHLNHNKEIAKLYKQNAEALGRVFPELGDMKQRLSASTDMGNISLQIPSIHPTISIESLPAVNHQPEFTACCISASADQAVIDGALAMAWTILDIASDKVLREKLMRARK